MTTALLADLVDDAGLFPPTSLPMRDALARHLADADAGSPVLTHRFLCPTSRLDDLRRHLPDRPLRLGLIVDGPGEPDLTGLPGVTVDTVEVRLPSGPVPPQRNHPDAPAEPEGLASASARRLAPWLPEGARLFVEVTPDALPMWTEPGVGLKVRCGGLEPKAFPSAHLLGHFIRYCARHGVPFKATAGLHHAVRHPDPSFGVYRHGFLNLLLATCAAVEDRDPVPVLELGDPAQLVRLARAVSPPEARRARALFVCYGSCNTAAPLDDLAELGLIDRPAAAGAGAERTA
ncbi:hypothetical protein HNP84_009310 [Thermocatellispora tengchongensis]|uniref:Uncharacterized protein n=1 Tax=Thermocatellispora tengchongensis TaxID=1073253 RepID=A0A840PR27_9ACTN|nr:hypothetical protein [Thermocatellispora tengchongensis]MBB5139547.1 hypothetical protein [Thermocatellispora tengchongensis]